jgi:hypothetical protein
MELDLSGLVVVGGAAGYEEITATAAALAGAKRVFAISREQKRRPAAGESRERELPLARLANVAGRVEMVGRMHPRAWHGVDILVRCPELEPVSRSVVELLPPAAVVALMAEPWEIRPTVIDIEACEEAGIKVAAPKLSHPHVAQLPDLARLCSGLVKDAGIDPEGARIAILSDTPCGPFIESALADRGARVQTFPHPLLLTPGDWDAVVVALRPSNKPPMDINGLAAIMKNSRGAQLVQFSGEVDRVAARYFGLQLWPQRRPARGALGIPAAALGAASIIRRLVGGLKAAETVRRRGVESGSATIGFVVERADMLR